MILEGETPRGRSALSIAAAVPYDRDRLLYLLYNGDQYDTVLVVLAIPYDGDQYDTVLVALAIPYDVDQYDTVLVATVLYDAVAGAIRAPRTR